MYQRIVNELSWPEMEDKYADLYNLCHARLVADFHFIPIEEVCFEPIVFVVIDTSLPAATRCDSYGRIRADI